MRSMSSLMIVVVICAASVLGVTGVTSAIVIATDSFDYADGDLGGSAGGDNWNRRGDTSGWNVTGGQVGRGSLGGGGSATAYYKAHTHTNEPVLRAEIEMTIPSNSPSGAGGSFWGQLLLGLHQSNSTSGGTFPSTANAYFLRIRGSQDFNLEKYDGGNAVLAGMPAPSGDQGGGGWTNFNGHDTKSWNHNDAAGNLALDTPYIVAIERNANTNTVSGSVTRKSDSVVVAQGSFVDPGVMHTGDHVSLLLQGGGGGGHAGSYVLDNFSLSTPGTIPEPTRLVLVIMGAVALICGRRSR